MEDVYSTYQFQLVTPEGVAYVTDEDNDVECTLGKCHTTSHMAAVHWNAVTRQLGVGVTSLKSSVLKGTSGMLISIPVAATEIAVGSKLTFTAKNITFIRQDGTKDALGNLVFTITIGSPAEKRTVLSELSTSAPEPATGVNVKVKRCINANEWSTLCLPFSMTAGQVKETFGNDVQLGDFNGCVVNDDTGNITAKFISAEAIEANHPYIIKVTSDIDEFNVDDVDIAPVANPTIDKDEQTTGTGRNKVTTYNSIIGNYINGTVVPDYALFLSENKFWFSIGLTMIKAYRAYFDFVTAGAEYDEEEAARITIALEQDATGIADKREATSNNRWYNLSGQRVQKPGKGIYLKEGKKVVVK